MCACRPGPGDIVDNALRKCDVAEGKCISFRCDCFHTCVVVTIQSRYYLNVCFLSFYSRLSPRLFSPPGRCNPSMRELRVSVGLPLLLPCVQLSPRSCSWEHPPHRHTRQHHSDLQVTVTEDSLGEYICTCQVHRLSCRLTTLTLFHLFLLL